VKVGNNGGTAHPRPILFSSVHVCKESVAEALDELVCLLKFVFHHESWLEKETPRPAKQHEHLEIFVRN